MQVVPVTSVVGHAHSASNLGGAGNVGNAGTVVT